jgi:hypothetical protein
MGKPQTIIGAERFHFRVRDGIGWFPLAIAARQAGGKADTNLLLSFGNVVYAFDCRGCLTTNTNLHNFEAAWVLYDQASRSISTG